MKNQTKSSLLIALAALITLSSCEKNEISSISINQTTIEMHVGESDSLVATITFTGELSEIPVSWTVDNNNIVSITEKRDAGATSKSGSNNSIQKEVIITALQAGTAKITIGSGEKSVSCDITVLQRDFSFNQAYVSNWGDYYDIGNNNFDMYLLENTLSFNAEGKLTGNGTLLYLDFNVPITQNEIAAGYFTSAENGNINTFFPGEKFQSEDEVSYGGARFIEIENGQNKETFLVQSGHFAFVAEGNSYIIGGEMITETGEKIPFTYTGSTTLSDKKPIPEEISPAFTKGNLYFDGDAYETGTSNNFTVLLMTENVNLSSEELNGEILMLEFNTALSATNHIPDGTYNMISELAYENIQPLTLVLGYTTQSNQNWGCWFYSDTTTKKLKTGNAVVSKSASTYTIQYELFDRFGSKIYGTYTGSLNFVQPSQIQSASAKMKSLKGGRGLEKNNINLNNKPNKFNNF